MLSRNAFLSFYFQNSTFGFMDGSWILFFEDFKIRRNFKEAGAFLLPESRLSESICIMQKRKYPFGDWVTWIYTHFVQTNASEMQEFRNELMHELVQSSNHTYKRNLLFVLRYLKAEDELDGRFYDFLLEFIGNANEKHAARVNAILLIEEWYLKSYPTLIPEVRELIEISGFDESASLRAAKKNFQKFEKRIKKLT